MIKTFTRILNEIAYGGNLGFEDMVSFYRKASSEQIKKMEKVAKANDWNSFKKLIKQVLKRELVGPAVSTTSEK